MYTGTQILRRGTNRDVYTFMHLWRTLGTLPNKHLFQNVYALSHYGPVQRAVERKKLLPGESGFTFSQQEIVNPQSPSIGFLLSTALCTGT